VAKKTADSMKGHPAQQKSLFEEAFLISMNQQTG